jgi:hypothetical protein
MQARFASYYLNEFSKSIREFLMRSSPDTKTIPNMTKFATLLADELYKGQLTIDMIQMTEFLLFVIDKYGQGFDASQLNALTPFTKQCMRCIFYCFAVLNGSQTDVENSTSMLTLCLNYRKLLFNPKILDVEQCKLLIHHIWAFVCSNDPDLAEAAHDVFTLFIMLWLLMISFGRLLFCSDLNCFK